MERVCFTYPRSHQSTLKNIDLVVHYGDRVGIVGLNGAGKSTLVKVMVGINGSNQAASEGLQATSGTVEKHPRARFAFFSQHAVDELEEKGSRDQTITALSELMTTVAGQLSEHEVRGLLSAMGLAGRTASDVPMAGLSGGQRVKAIISQSIRRISDILSSRFELRWQS
jgi:ATPase subunit of ABC transporter with duplicated ATPase domains